MEGIAMGAMQDKRVCIFSFFIFLGFMGAAFATTTLSGCANITVSDTYALNQSIASAGFACINITTSNVALDCQGYTISAGSPSNGYRAIYTPNAVSNISILNCNMANITIANNKQVTTFILQNINSTESNYTSSIWANGATITNVMFNNSGNDTLVPNKITNSAIANSTFISDTGFALHAVTGTSGFSSTTFTNNTFISGGPAVASLNANAGTGNTFVLNNFTCTGACLLYMNDTVSGNSYYASVNGITQGNIWPNVINGSVYVYGSVNSSVRGFYVGGGGTGYPYNNATSLGMVTSNVVDWAPLTPSSGFVCGTLASAGTYTMIGNLSTNNADCFDITAQNVTLNCNGFSILQTNNNQKNGIQVTSSATGATIANCTISNFLYGVYLNHATGAQVYGINAYNNSNDISLGNSASGNTLFNFNATGTHSNGVYMSSVSGNTLYNFNASGTSSGVHMTSADNNTLANFTAASSSSSTYALWVGASNNNNITNFNATSSNSSSGYSAAYIGGNNNFIANGRISDLGGTRAAYLAWATNTTFANNTLLNATTLLYVDPNSGSNTIYWNNFTNIGNNSTNAPLFYVNDTSGGTDFYNGTAPNGTNEGNIWGNVMNGSVNITGATNSSGFISLYVGTGGSGYPYNTANSQGMVQGAIDYAPLTALQGADPSPSPTPSSSSVTSGGGSSSAQITLAYSFDCATGRLDVSTSPAASSTRIRLNKENTFAPLFAGTDSSGVAHFTIIDSGTYSADISGAHYGTLGGISLKLCPAPTPPAVPPEQNKTAGQPPANSTTPAQGNRTTPPAAVPPQLQNQTPAVPPEQNLAPSQQPVAALAQQAINSAESALEASAKQGSTATQASQALAGARSAFAAGDYAGAERLANLTISYLMPAPAAKNQASGAASQNPSAVAGGNAPICYGLAAIAIILLAMAIYQKFSKKKKGL